MANLHTKVEVSWCTRYEAINGSAKYRKWGDWKWLGVLKVVGNVIIRYSAFKFLFDFNRNYAVIFIVFEMSRAFFESC